MNAFRIVPAGDAALLVQFAERMDPGINADVLAVAQAVRRAGLAGVRDVVSTYRSVAVYFDARRTDHGELLTTLDALARTCTGDGSPCGGRVVGPYDDPSPVRYGDPSPVQVPVCYGGEFGPDLAVVAAFGGVDDEDVIRLHAARTYRVYMLGFVPGFAYMGTVDERIAAPRRAEPRLRVPAGSVGIAGPQTGIYPSSTPGGWQLVGRTPIAPFDLSRMRPFLFEAGVAVQFHPIEPAEYARLRNAH